MENYLPQWFPLNIGLAILFSIVVNIIIAISGIIPSAFITAGNISYFGLHTGLLVSIIGEAAGAIVSFMLYRKGLNKLTANKNLNNKLLLKLKNTGNLASIFLVLILRVLPFVPSGVVTMTAAFSKMGLLSFSVASTLGKIPSLLIEAYSVNYLLGFKTEWQIGIILFVVLLYIIYRLLRRLRT
jgi:uncharacterized membrane protein YdjX (TVP38/TMEM64 family)